MKTKNNKHLISRMDNVIKQDNLVDEVRDFVSKLNNVSIYKGKYIIVEPDNVAKLEQKAALIAAAPEMFDVLQLIGTIANVGLDTNSDYKNRMKRISEHATKILKKARGE